MVSVYSSSVRVNSRVDSVGCGSGMGALPMSAVRGAGGIGVVISLVCAHGIFRLVDEVRHDGCLIEYKEEVSAVFESWLE
jgi:hypothetical protein